MLASILGYLWGGDIPVQPPETVPEPTTPGRGSGKGKGQRFGSDYLPFSDDYWLARETTIQADQPKTVHFAESAPVRRAPVQREITAMEMQLSSLRQQLAEAPSIDALKAIAGQIRALKALA